MPGPHRVTHKRIRRSSDEVYYEGDEFEPTDAELSAFGDRLEPVDDDPDDEEDPPPEDELPFDPADYTNDEVAEEVEDVDDAAELEALLEAEQEDQDRSGATDAIESRLEEVEG